MKAEVPGSNLGKRLIEDREHGLRRRGLFNALDSRLQAQRLERVGHVHAVRPPFHANSAGEWRRRATLGANRISALSEHGPLMGGSP